MIKVNVREHPYFKRKGSDIYTDKFITFTQAIFGGVIKVNTISGPVEVKIRPGTAHADTITLEN